MKIIEFKFEYLPESAQFCTDTVIHTFHETGFIEFKGYCMINSMASPVDIEIEAQEKDRYILHIHTVCELIAMSEKCIFLSGKMECNAVNQSLQMTARERIIREH
ncbi:MAG: hypothetical protein D3926_09815 [Desulfobacteraceae bacterium]|nr:MAG: hypothetical protein D3926_09815 [Desulfobacteraceae bacterium]